MKLTRTPDPKTASSSWKGYTLDEIRYQRVLALAAIEMEKKTLAASAEDARQQVPFFRESRGKGLFKALSYFEYAFIAVRLWKRFRGIFKKKRG